MNAVFELDLLVVAREEARFLYKRFPESVKVCYVRKVRKVQLVQSSFSWSGSELRCKECEPYLSACIFDLMSTWILQSVSVSQSWFTETRFSFHGSVYRKVNQMLHCAFNIVKFLICCRQTQKLQLHGRSVRCFGTSVMKLTGLLYMDLNGVQTFEWLYNPLSRQHGNGC